MAKRTTPEGIVKQAICEYLEATNHEFWLQESQGTFDPRRKIFLKKNSPYQINGVADIPVLLEYNDLPYTVWLEVKKPKVKGVSSAGVQSDSQKGFQDKVERKKGFYYVVHSIEEVQAALDDAYKQMVLRVNDLLNKIEPLR